MPKHFRDLMPQPMPPPSTIRRSCTPPPLPDAPPLQVQGTHHSSTTGHFLSSRIRRIFRTPRNIFGLIRQYFLEHLPSPDPEEFATLVDLSDLPTNTQAEPTLIPSDASFYPFPNSSSFRLGHWYWNEGVQKSQQSFKDLLDIIRHPSFSTDDIRHTKWGEINTTLGNSMKSDSEWVDNWKKTSVPISVPFHRRQRDPGPQDFVGADLYH